MSETDMQKLFKDWYENVYLKTTQKFKERKDTFKTISNEEVKPVYTSDDIKDIDYKEKIGMPGSYPFTRGIQPTMYRGRFWTMRQYAGFGNAAESNKRYKYLLENGQTGLSVAFDLPTQIGYDSDHIMSVGEVGKVGVAIDSLEDMEILFNDIPLDKVSTSMTINAPAMVLLAMYMVVGEKNGVSADQLTGTIQNDILKEYIARGTYIFPPKPSMRLITDIFEYCSKNLPKFNTISISGYHIREAGSTAAQEVGFTLADGIAYVDAAIKAGLDKDAFGQRLSFFFNAYTDLLEEVAKYRAARRLWAKIMKERFNCTNPKSMMLRFHTQTAGSSLTAQQPENNIIRVAIQTLAATLGGTQSLHTNSYDEALGLPTEESVRIALRTQQVVAYESGIASTIDPLGGSYFIEELTDKIEKEAMKYINKIDDLGGMVAAIENGYVQQAIQNSAYQLQKTIEQGENIVVGVNKFTIDKEAKAEVLKVDPKLQEEQSKRLAKLRANRNNEKVQIHLDKIREHAKSDKNLFPPIVDAVREYVTLGEICQILREEFGEHKENVIL